MNQLQPRSPNERPDRNPPLYYTLGHVEENGEIRKVYLTPTRVAQGGMALVYICPLPPGMDFHGGNVVAIKRLRDWLEVGDLLTIMMREAKLWLLLGSHRCIVEMIQISWGQQTPTLMLEHVPRSLREELDTRLRLGITEVLLVALSVVAALEHAAHVVPGFVHGDIKPENILTTPSNEYKLTDFGLARAAKEAGLQGAGTPAYMAPEIFAGAQSSSSSDIYALACTMFEMLSGQPVFPRSLSRLEYQRHHAIVDTPALEHFREDLPEGLADLVNEGLRKGADSRPSISDFQEKLSTIARKCGLDFEVPPLDPPNNIQLVNTADSLWRMGFDEQSLKLVKAVLDDRAATTESRLRAFTIAAEIYLRRDDWEAAKSVLDQGAKIVDQCDRLFQAQYLVVKGNYVRLCTQDLREAHRYALQCVDLAPELDENWYNLAGSYAALGKFSDAVASLEQALRQNVRLDFFDRMVALQMTLRSRSEALRYADWAVSCHPTSGWAHGLRCIVLGCFGGDPHDRELMHKDAQWALSDPHTPDFIP